jgi:short-subunit dehydrogenase
VALDGMVEQGFGALYNMKGMGSNGRKQRGVNLYGTTKAAIRYLNEALAMETGDLPVIVGALAPGMVITDMITEPYEDRPERWEKDKRIFNIIGDRVESVTPWLAAEILKNDKSGVTIKRYKPWSVFLRFLTAPFVKRQVVD